MSGVSVTPSSSETTFSAPQMQVLTQYLEILVRQQNDELHERLDQMANRDNYEGNTRRRDNDGEPHQNRMEGVKLKIPPFKEKKKDPGAYLEWELKIEHLFSCYNYT